MKKLPIILTFSILLNLTLSMVYLNRGQPESTQEEKALRIAILTPVTHPSLEQIERGFVETLSKDRALNCQFVTYNAQGNKTLMRSELEEIARQQFDLVFAICTTPARMAKEVFEKKGLKIPIIFAAVPNPTGLGLIESEASSGNLLTGVSELVDYEKALKLLKYFRKNLDTLLLVYDPTLDCGSQDEISRLQEIASRLSLRIKPIEVFKANEMLQKVSAFISEGQALMVLKDNTVVTGLDVLVKLCNKQGIPLLASDLDSVDRGAALGYGVFEYDFGVEGAKKALKVLKEGKCPAEIPTTPLEIFKLRVNPAVLAQQGLEISPETLFFIQSGAP
ncbi:MAG: ABC transporter substrate-binding protein [Parachlamydia sp.]|nr:ABC transporter substrate-binding protein [Parachlamydia sp.]